MNQIHAALIAFFVIQVTAVAPLLAVEEVTDEDLKPFPPPGQGEHRYVIALPELENEEAHKVEITVGKVVEVDRRNRYFFGGKLVQESIKGWGYPLFRLKEVGPMAGTRIAVPEGEPKVKRFVPVRGGLDLIRYNSKIPVVVYVPDGFAVKYRVWKAGEAAEARRR